MDARVKPGHDTEGVAAGRGRTEARAIAGVIAARSGAIAAPSGVIAAPSGVIAGLDPAIHDESPHAQP